MRAWASVVEEAGRSDVRPRGRAASRRPSGRRRRPGRRRGSPRSRSASSQSARALRLLSASPRPDRSWLGRAAAHVVEVDHHADRDLDAVGALAPVVHERGDGRGEAVVGQARGHGDHRQPGEAGGVLGDVDRAAAADPDDGVVGARRAASAASSARPRACRPRRAKTSALPQLRAAARRRSARPGPGRRRRRRRPPAEIRRSASSVPMPPTAPRRTSIASGKATIRASSGTRPPAPGPGRRGRRPRPSRRRRSAPRRPSPPRSASSWKPSS